MYDVIVIGAGPSGLMCCANAKGSAKILLLEKNDKLGSKILASGNGRCNVCNLKSNMDFLEEITTSNKKFILSSLSEFSSYDICDYFYERNVSLKQEEDDKMFPVSDKAVDILNAIVKDIPSNVTIKLSESLIDLTYDNVFKVVTNKETYMAKKVVLAMGGKSYPALGTTGDAYDILKKFDLKINTLLPALVPLNSNLELIKNKSLQGQTLENILVSYKNKSFYGNVLITHFGVTGPAIFRISEFVVKDLLNNKEVTINLDLIPDVSYDTLFNNAISDQSKRIQSIFKGLVNQTVLKVILGSYFNEKISTLGNKVVSKIINLFKEFSVPIYDNKGFKSAFVTSGGLDLKEVDAKTLEVKKVPNLYVCGELLDIHGPTGGYNITMCLSMGHKVGNVIKNAKF